MYATRSAKKRSRTSDQPSEELVKEPLLEGLTLSRDKKSVKVDEKLLSRLVPISEEPTINPFENSLIFLETMQNGKPLTLEFLQECSQTMKSNPDSVKMAEIIGNLPLDLVAMKNSVMLEDNWEYNVKVTGNPKVTDQNYTGRCWAFSFYNTLRYNIINKFNLDHKFEFSESYLYFYDKIERSNLFLEYMWNLRWNNLQDPEVRMFTNPGNHMLSDGGCYHYAHNLAQKYGLVPKNIYGESFNCKASEYMNSTLILVLNHMALEIFRNKKKWTGAKFESKKAEYMKTIYDLVVKFLGEPPKPTDKFTWTYKNAHGDMQTVPNLTPEKFFRVVVQAPDNMVIINDPRHPETYYCPSYSEYSINMIGGNPATYINLPMDEFKKVVAESLKNDTPVWFASDMSQCLDPETNTSDPKRFDYSSVLGYNVVYDKGDQLDMLTAVGNHAMVFNGVDTVDNQDGCVVGYKKWRIENSWGSKGSDDDEFDHGYYRMTDEYVDKYVYMAAVDSNYFEPSVVEKILENTKKGLTYTYKYTDAFSSQSLKNCCRSCKKGPRIFKK